MRRLDKDQRTRADTATAQAADGDRTGQEAVPPQKCDSRAGLWPAQRVARCQALPAQGSQPRSVRMAPAGHRVQSQEPPRGVDVWGQPSVALWGRSAAPTGALPDRRTPPSPTPSALATASLTQPTNLKSLHARVHVYLPLSGVSPGFSRRPHKGMKMGWWGRSAASERSLLVNQQVPCLTAAPRPHQRRLRHFRRFVHTIRHLTTSLTQPTMPHTNTMRTASLMGGVCWSALAIHRTFTYPCRPVKGEGVMQRSLTYMGGQAFRGSRL